MKSQLASTCQFDHIFNAVAMHFLNDESAHQVLIFKRFKDRRIASSAIDTEVAQCNTLSQARNAANMATLDELSKVEG